MCASRGAGLAGGTVRSGPMLGITNGVGLAFGAIASMRAPSVDRRRHRRPGGLTGSGRQRRDDRDDEHGRGGSLGHVRTVPGGGTLDSYAARRGASLPRCVARRASCAVGSRSSTRACTRARVAELRLERRLSDRLRRTPVRGDRCPRAAARGRWFAIAPSSRRQLLNLDPRLQETKIVNLTLAAAGHGRPADPSGRGLLVLEPRRAADGGARLRRRA